MMKRFGVSLAVCFAAMIWATVAPAATDMVTGWGIGQSSSGKFIASIGSLGPGQYRESDSRDGRFVSENTQYYQWLLGFLTDFNAALVDEDKQQKQISRRMGWIYGCATGATNTRRRMYSRA